MSGPLHLPVLSRPDLAFIRAPGPGLGNLLFPIARAIVGQQRLGSTVVVPTLRQVKLGPWLRGERDKRTYGDILRHRTPSELRNWLAAQIARDPTPESRAHPEARVIRYAGLGRQFHDLAGHAEAVRAFLLQAGREPVPDAGIDIALHVRLGDFEPPAMGATGQNVQIPLDWYRAAYVSAVARLGLRSPRAMLFTDAAPQQVAQALGLPGLVPEPPGNALTSMMRMAQARVLVGSRSTFSLWAQFLGGATAIWPQGFELARYKPVDPETDILF